MTRNKIFLYFYFLLLFLALLATNLIYLEGVPHVPDSVAYLFMAKIFASGNIITDIPIPKDFVNYFPEILSVQKGTWLFQYPFGHPILLSFGVLLGFPNFIPPLIGTLTVLLLFLIAKDLYGLRIALFLLPLPLMSPFFMQNASSFMSHNTAAFYLVVSFFFLILHHKKEKKYSLLLTGIFLGLLFNTRPLTALPFLILQIIIILTQTKFKKREIWNYLLGFFILFLMYLGYNAITTGSAFHFQYYSQNQGLFNNNASDINLFFRERIDNFIVLFNNLGPMIYNIPQVLVYIFIFTPFLLFKGSYWDRIFFISLLLLPLVYFFYNGRFIMYGPRFWYEILPFIFLLTARSFEILSTKLFKTSIIILILCAAISGLTWFGILPSKNPDIFSPLKIRDLKGINFINNSIPGTLARYGITSGIIFVEDCGQEWWCYGSVFSKNSPKMDTSLVYVKDLGTEKNLTLKKYYPSKSFYKINYYTQELSRISK